MEQQKQKIHKKDDNRGAGNHGTALRLMKTERKHEVYIPGKYLKVMSMMTVTKAGKE